MVTGAAVNVDVHASWVDYLSGGTTGAPSSLNTKISTATTTDVVGSPAASTIRNVKTLYIANVHATLSVLVTIQHTDGTNVIQLESVTLLAGERIAIREGVASRIIDASGLEKTNGAASVFVKALIADHSNATTTATKVTDLDIVMGVGTWVFEYFIVYRSDTTTTGIKLGCNHSGTVTVFNYDMYGVDNLATAASGAMDQDALAATGQVFAVWAARAKSTTAPMITVSVDTINVDLLMMITGIATVTVSGNLELYHGSEAATTTLVKAQSGVRLTRIA